LTKAVGLNPDFIHNDVWGLELILSSKKRLRELGYKGGYATCQSTMTPEVIETDPKLMEGAYSVSQWVPDPTVPANLEFTRKIEEMTGRPSHLYQEGFYEGAMILLLGMDKAGTDSDLKRIADAMHSLDWMTPRGEKLKIEPDGHVAFEFWTMGQVRNGKLFAADRLFFEK
jgi:ABC-type branched-subunit amino acid transport system substrate-binding protein